MLSIENQFVMDPFIMETRRLVDLGKQTNLAGKERLEFVRTKQALARDERIRFREEKKRDEARIAEEAERARHHKKEDDEKIAAEAERIRQHKKEDEARIAEEAARIWRHKTEDEERIRKHEKEMCHLRIEADNIRRRRVLQEVWEDAEERRREEEDEDECSIPVTDRELWRKCFREQEALAREDAEEIRQHKEYRLQRAYEQLQWEKEDVARNAAKEEKEKVMQHEDVVKTAEIQRVDVMKTADEVMQHEEAEKMQPVKVMKTAAEEMVTPDSEASYETEDGGDASEQEANHHPTDDDDEDGRMSEGQERNGVGQERGPSLPAPSVRRSSKMPEDRQRFSSRRDHSPKRSSLERDRRMDGRRRSPLSKKSRYSSWARKIGKSRQVKKWWQWNFF